jgi:hypothetical protein
MLSEFRNNHILHPSQPPSLKKVERTRKYKMVTCISEESRVKQAYLPFPLKVMGVYRVSLRSPLSC